MEGILFVGAQWHRRHFSFAHLCTQPRTALVEHSAVLKIWRFFPVTRKYTQRKLLRELLAAGFQGKMDFIYLPLDPRTRSSRGFAFCNFTSPQAEKLERGWRKKDATFQNANYNDNGNLVSLIELILHIFILLLSREFINQCVVWV